MYVKHVHVTISNILCKKKQVEKIKERGSKGHNLAQQVLLSSPTFVLFNKPDQHHHQVFVRGISKVSHISDHTQGFVLSVLSQVRTAMPKRQHG